MDCPRLVKDSGYCDLSRAASVSALFLALIRPMAECARFPPGREPASGRGMSMDDGSLDEKRRRAAKNQALFREVNERIEDLARGTFHLVRVRVPKR